MFEVSSDPIDPMLSRSKLVNDAAGGFVSFEGWVRNHNEGQSVDALEYEIYDSLAKKEGAVIIQEAIEKYGIKEAYGIHRKGFLNIGDIAVWIGVSSAHRDAAFEACRYIIDEVKIRLPVWKKEHYSDGQAEWVNCQACSHAHAKRHGHDLPAATLADH
ncbi:molybdenum cofactor biosynthesis protein MoaE [Pseudobacteriovorax antillogorgiicola]|uniref:Molybdopterin synthase catalytic subunit n=1 Tax=Pseudobacteriovorax antillogorgiicola TaxID=1513793 RepID=A0A1Y6CAC4_9BACT|nr:molybdenum cofactor biosynthesis protein MoaE [Pseudobacteriovorax antillogorgiicola]TCS49011.1 molybdopterin synthase subunit MoaE [Pseudobacteriovorax antillogorgiicola]SMF53131.1 molybdopterin synthase subunit MoaE [Pseudobacteriovorax antillogorgiicola]